MNKILFFISSIALVACGSGSFKNSTTETMMVGTTEVSADACETFSSGFFGIGGDFPVSVTTKDEASSTKIKDGEGLKVGHYNIQADGTVVPVETSCADEKEPADDDDDKGEAEDKTDTEEPVIEPATGQSNQPQQEQDPTEGNPTN